MFEGVFCPSITITNVDGTIDYDNWGKHLDHLIDAGIDGVLLFGSIGEFYAIAVKTKAEAVRFAVSKVAGRMKVLVGVGDTNLDNVRTLAAESEVAGADALVAVSPYYFGPSPDCAKRYFSAVAKATTLPVILYNFPARTGNDLTPELVADLAAENQNIIGIKDTVDTISHTRKVIAARSARHGCAGTCSTSICSTRMHRTCPAFGRSCGTPRDSAWISYRRRNMDWPRPLQHHRRTVSW